MSAKPGTTSFSTYLLCEIGICNDHSAGVVSCSDRRLNCKVIVILFMPSSKKAHILSCDATDDEALLPCEPSASSSAAYRGQRVPATHVRIQGSAG